VPKGGDTRAAAAAKGNKVGRPRTQPAAAKEKKLHADVAGRILESIDEMEYWRQLLRADTPAKQLHTLPLSERLAIKSSLEYITNRYRGKATEKIEGSFDPAKPFVLTIEHIGRNSRPATPAAAKAK